MTYEQLWYTIKELSRYLYDKACVITDFQTDF